MRFLLISLLALQDVDSLIEQLDDRDPEVREKAEAELVKKGPAALPALERAAKEGPEEVRARAASAILRIRWVDAAPAMPGGDVRDALRQTLASGDFSGAGGMPLDTAFSDAGVELPQDEAKFPCFEGFLDLAPYKTIQRSKTRVGSLGLWRAKGLQIVTGERAPRFAVVSGKFDLAKATWDEKGHAIAALADVAKGPGWNGLYLESRTAGKGYALFTFCWEQDKPYPNLRHVLVTESCAVLAIGYQ